MINRVKELLCMTDLQCQVYLTRVLNEMGYTVVVGRNKTDVAADFIFAYPPDKQVIPVLLMAHWDTVRTKGGKITDEPVTLFEEYGKIENASGILGADDRAGIGVILETIDEFNEKPLVLFTNFEESGGSGMKQFLASGLFDEWEDYIYLTISCDRCGHNQWVCYYNNGNDELESIMARVGYVEAYGTWTDGSSLAIKHNLAHVNVSCGGYLQHTADEFLLVDSYLGCIDRLSNLVERIDHKILRVEKKSYGTLLYGKSGANTQTVTLPGGTSDTYDVTPTMVHEPLNAPLTVRLPHPECEVCGRNEYGVTFNTKARRFLCFKCINRIHDKYKEISPLTCHLGKEDLRQERMRTREANMLLNKKPSAHAVKYPCCPKCHSNTHVSWYTKEAGFVCTQCRYAHTKNPEKDIWDGRFWIMDGKKIYIIGDLVYESSLDDKQLLRSHPVAGHDFIKVCNTCGAYSPAITPVDIRYSNRDLSIAMCSSCREALGDLIDDYEDSLRPIISGSESDVPW